VDLTFAIAVRNKSEEDLKEVLSVEPIAVKQAYSALLTFILEGAKENEDPATLKGALEEHKLSAKRADHIASRYNETKSSIRRLLATNTFHFPRVVDVDWRLDYVIKSNSVEKINMPVYRIALKTDEMEGKQGSVEFSCSLEQLQDLVSKLKDASKQLERSAARA